MVPTLEDLKFMRADKMEKTWDCWAYAKERQRVLIFLRTQAHGLSWNSALKVNKLADAIERGDHEE